MNETILNILMQLFAILTDIQQEKKSGKARILVKRYLKRQYNKEIVDINLTLFDEYLALFHDSALNGRKKSKRDSSNAVKILKICEQINKQLQLEQRILVVVELLEFIKKDDITETEIDTITTIARYFNIPDDDFRNIKNFILGEINSFNENKNLLIIDSDSLYDTKNIKHLFHSSLEGQIQFLHITVSNTLIFLYLGKENIYLNGHNIDVNRTYVFADGSVIKSSRLEPIYYGKIASVFFDEKIKHKINYSAQNIEYKFSNGTTGLCSFDFEECSGQLVGIMGGSGSGKSTLLNVMSGNLLLANGSITINGFDLHKDKERLQGLIGFVPQDDMLIEELTVYQNLYYNAKLCFDNYTEEQIKVTIDKALRRFDLWEARNLKVGNPLNKFISGGQRKRLNIALELMREPAILFVDEPTSGLSSVDSEKVMQLLKRQTLKGRLVIVNIHQPASDIYKLFNRLLIIDKGGRVIYNGNPSEAIVYFKMQSNHINADESQCPTCGNINTDLPLRVVEERIVNEYGKLTRIRKTSPQEWYKTFRKYEKRKNEKKEVKVPLQTKKQELQELPEIDFQRPKAFKQFKIFTIRDVLSKLTNRQYMIVSMLEAPLLAVILGYFTKYLVGIPGDPYFYIFSQNKNLPAYLFMSVIVALFLGMTISADEIIKDRKIVKREKFLNLSRFSYLHSKMIIVFTISAIQMFLYVLIGNSILEIKGMFFQYWLILFITSCASNLIGLNISAAFNSVITIYILIPFILVPQMLLSGVIVNFNDLHKKITNLEYTPVIGDLMLARWTYEGLAVLQFKNNNYQKHFFEIEQKLSNASYMSNYFVPELQSKLAFFALNTPQKKKLNECEANIKLLHNELPKIINKNLPIKYDFTNEDILSLTIKDFDDKLVKKTRIYLKYVKRYYEVKYSKILSERDKVYKKLKQKYTNKQILKLQRTYYNEALSNFVKNKNNLIKIYEFDGRLLRHFEPVFMEPTSKFGRAAYYSSKKNLFRLSINTYWFNIGVIMLISFILYIMLLHDTFNKLIKIFDNLRVKLHLKKIENNPGNIIYNPADLNKKKQ